MFTLAAFTNWRRIEISPSMNITPLWPPKAHRRLLAWRRNVASRNQVRLHPLAIRVMQGLESREGKNGSLIDIKIRKGKEMNQQAIRRGFWFASACVVAGLALAQVSAGRGISVHTLQQN